MAQVLTFMMGAIFGNIIGIIVAALISADDNE